MLILHKQSAYSAQKREREWCSFSLSISPFWVSKANIGCLSWLR